MVFPFDKSVNASLILKPSPSICNLRQFYEEETNLTACSLVLTPRKSTYNVSDDIINEVPEEEEEEEEEEKEKEDSHDDSNESTTRHDKLTHSKTARDIYDQCYTKLPYDRYITILGEDTDTSRAVCKEFMGLFNHWPRSLVNSLRLMCSRLYFVGEATQIDNVLEIFCKSWVIDNPVNPIGNYKSLHVVCFSIFILNSDLHNEQNLEVKFTSDEFVRNTVAALKEQQECKPKNIDQLESYLKDAYNSIRSKELEICRPRKQPMKTNGNNGNNTRESTPHFRVDSLSNISIKSKNTKRLSSLSSSISLGSNSTAFTDPYLAQNYDVEYKKEIFDDFLETLGPPWSIEGLLKTEYSPQPAKHKKKWLGRWLSPSTSSSTNSNNSQRLKIDSSLDIYDTTNWRSNAVFVSKGLLKQCSFQSKEDLDNYIKAKQEIFASSILTYNLYSATASLVDNNTIFSNVSYNNKNGIPWVLTLPNLLTNDYNEDQKILYYSPNLEIANKFIETCNFWAARITSIPLDNKAVTNLQYGWNNDVFTKSKKELAAFKLANWECLLSIESSFIPSSSDLIAQFDNLKNYLNSLSIQLEHHNNLKVSLEEIWGGDDELKGKYIVVMNNWTEKYIHLYKQTDKFSTYLDSLASAISFRDSKV